MKTNISRRDFLKLTSLCLLSQVLPFQHGRRDFSFSSTKPNVLVVVFDALSALDVPFQGFSRNTTPNLNRIIERATVYHNHYSGGNFTTPGTASLLTGTLPWTHRAINKYGTVTKSVVEQNIFNAFDKEQYFRFGYTHNAYAEKFLTQFEDSLDHHIPLQSLYLAKDWVATLFEDDYDIAVLAKELTLDSKQLSLLKNSLFLPDIYGQTITRGKEKVQEKYSELFPRGLPSQSGDNYFLLEDGIDYLMEYLGKVPQPFVGYFHFYPPHFPYNPPVEFSRLFEGDKYSPPRKPEHLFTNEEKYEKIQQHHLHYDQFIAYADAEFARLYEFMENEGLLENTWVVFTSDHGEMFERGIYGHSTKTLFEPVIKIPLLIFEPGQSARRNVFTPTSAVDVLPTLLHVSGQLIPEKVEGEVLPPFGKSQNDFERSIFSVDARTNAKFEPLTEASVAIIKGQYKLHAYFGYPQLPPGEPLFELYDLKNDPEELENLYTTRVSLARELQNELEEKVNQVNEPYL